MSQKKGLALICGLGNPGLEHKAQRHNIGFMVLESLIANSDTHSQKSNKHCLTTQCEMNGHALICLQPQNYMNNSGQVLQRWLQYHKKKASDLLVIYDDIDLPFGSLRLRARGSAGTHNGLRDIVAQCGTKEIPRLRLGIGPDHPISDLSNFVLSPFSQAEKKQLPKFIEVAVDIVKQLQTHSLTTVMNQYTKNSLEESDK
ncbi:MAG: aminoacyl-tRNA hydrolase [bacterium]